MGKSLFVVGTDTDVGKTLVTAGIVNVLRKNGHHAIGFKPIQSGGILKEQNLVAEDVELVKQISKIKEDSKKMNTYCLKEAVSPHLAAELEEVEIDINKIIEDYRKLQEDYEYVVVEGAGGVIVPLVRNKYYIHDLIRDLNIPVVVVARAGVGTINHTVLTVEYLKHLGIKVKGIVINRYKGTFYEKDNIEVIKEITGLNILTTIPEVVFNKEDDPISCIRQALEISFETDNVLNFFVE